MLQSALSLTGGYADWQNHLESMKHTVDKVLNPSACSTVNDFDRERLGAVVKFLRELITPSQPEELTTEDFLSKVASDSEPTFVPDLDLHQCLRECASLEAWQANSKIGMDKKLEKLAERTEAFLSSSSRSLLATNAPAEELRVVSDVLEHLLLHSYPLLFR